MAAAAPGVAQPLRMRFGYVPGRPVLSELSGAGKTTVRGADGIVVAEESGPAEQGSHRELVAAARRYRGLLEGQVRRTDGAAQA